MRPGVSHGCAKGCRECLQWPQTLGNVEFFMVQFVL